MSLKLKWLFLLSLLSINSYTQIISNDCSNLTSTWEFNSIGQNSGYWLLDNDSDYATSEVIDLCPYNSLTLTSNLRSYGSGSAPECTIEISDDNGLTWSAGFTTISSIPNSYTNYNYTFGPIASSTVKMRWKRSNGSRGLRINNITLTGSGGGSCGPPPDVTLSSTNPATSSSTIFQNEANHEIYSFNISAVNNNATLSNVNFTTSGSYASSNITNFKLWYSADATFNPTTSTFIENITSDVGVGNHSFSGLSQLINNNSTAHFFLTTDIPCNATNGNTLIINAITTSDLTFVSANKTGIAYASDAHTIQTASPYEVSSFTTLDCENNSTTLNWTDLPCNDTIIIFATDNSFSTTLPTGNGSSYISNPSFGAGTAFDGGFCVYKGSGNTETITNLTNNTPYTYKVFTRNDLLWSSGVEVSCSPIIAYCNAGATNDDDSEIENVFLSGENYDINNNTTNLCTGTSGGELSDFTSMSADLSIGNTYTLNVEFGDCDGETQYDAAGGVWIDWNNDGDFNDTNETIGTVDLEISSGNIVENFNISVSPIQALGSYRMRIIQEEGGNAETILPCDIFNYGSAEDYTIDIVMTCTPTHTITDFAPTSGPIATEVTITGSGFTPATSVTFGSIAATLISQSTNQLVVEVPNGASTSNIIILENGCTVLSSSNFTLISKTNSCSTSTFNDIIITEVYDSDGGNVWYIELYNPTNSSINLDAFSSDYEIKRYGTIGDTSSTRTIDLTGIALANSTFTLQIGNASPNPCNITFDFLENGAGINDNDEIKLFKNGASIDVVECPDDIGYSILRSITSVGPSATYNFEDWTTHSSESCDDLGSFILPDSSPSVNMQPLDISTCNSSINFNMTAFANNGGTLTYQWYYNDGSASWNEVNTSNLPLVIVNGETSNHLELSGAFINYSSYQFYCLVTENGLCSSASDAAQLKNESTVWDGTSWNNGFPSASMTAVINSNYNTNNSDEPSFTSCSLVINSNFSLTIASNTYVEVINNVVNNGTITVQDSGAFVQVDNNATYNDTDSSALPFAAIIERKTDYLAAWYEYTYWSSPVANETFGSALQNALPSRRFGFNAANFQDSTYETNNNNATVIGAGIDDVDDNGDDWYLKSSSETLLPGYGYAATHSNSAFTSPGNYLYIFKGTLNNGTITVPVERNDNETGDENWNLIGNPYPSAIDAKLFFDENNYTTNPTNGTLDGAIYLWSQTTPPSSTNNGNQQLNFDINDYVVINYTGISVGGATSHIGTGQAFFTPYSDAVPSTSGYVTFTNSMRVINNNDQFYKTNAITSTQDNKLWLTLENDFGLKDNILIGYVQGATSGYDGASFDAKRNGAAISSLAFYSSISNLTRKLTIQGKNSSDLTLDEEITLGFLSDVNSPSIFTLSITEKQGDFLTNNTIFLKDNLLNIYHNLSTSNYTFTSEKGEFNTRFKIVFKDELLSTTHFEANANSLTIVELNNDEVKFTVNKYLKIKAIKIINVLGREVHAFSGNNYTETYNLSQLSNAPYIARVTLNNGKIITKKAIKK